MMIVQNPTTIFNSHSVSQAIWDNTCQLTVTVQYPGAAPVTCFTAVPLSATAAAPTLRYSGAQAGSLYSVIMVDRDAVSAANPSWSPIRHWTIVNVAGSELLAGLNPSNTQGMILSQYIQPAVRDSLPCRILLSVVLNFSVFQFVLNTAAVVLRVASLPLLRVRAERWYAGHGHVLCLANLLPHPAVELPGLGQLQ